MADSQLHHSLAFLALVASVGRIGANAHEVQPRVILHTYN